MNEDNPIPFNLKILDTCLPSYFQGFGGPVIAFPVDARMTYSELFGKLTDDDAWPSNADIEDIRLAVVDLVGQAHSAESRPYADIGPHAPPTTHFVSQHPTIPDMWLVIDQENGEILSSWPTEIEGNIQAWEVSGKSSSIDGVYAYFGIELEVPDGYRVDTQGKRWTWLKLDGTKVVNGFDTEMEAKVAAWKHHLQKQDFRGVAENYEQLHDGLSNMIESGRLTEMDIPEDYTWLVESLAHLASK